MESHFRSILKAVTWRAGGTFVTMAVAWLVVGQVGIAAKIGIVDTIFKIGVFYIHERVWNRVNFGKQKPPEYQI
ncbi:MAG: DUF2061 domain-containing protein [Sedimentisphaerales bacterium]|nr:DUF2061 domain-containing protein [Sedimentisphaerales bacterium]